jgi:chromosome segregation ATPase
MSRYFDFINLALVALLGGLCVTQWSHEKNYARQFADLRQIAASQADKLAVQTEALQRSGEDIDGFKREIVNLKDQADKNDDVIRQQKAQVFQLEADNGKITHQLADWKKAVDDYRQGVASRDENIKTLLAQRDQLVAANKEVAAKANQAVLAYNDLTAKYEDLVNKYNTLAARYQSEHATPSTPESSPK